VRLRGAKRLLQGLQALLEGIKFGLLAIGLVGAKRQINAAGREMV
jgi:hypothetical protein